MTGFGASRIEVGDRVLSLELRSVNHRYCDIRAHLPPDLTALETSIEARVRQRIARGRVDATLSVSFMGETDRSLSVDVARARAYRDAGERLALELGIPGDLTLGMVLAAPGVIRVSEAAEDIAALSDGVERALSLALAGLCKMREEEGSNLCNELTRLLDSVEVLLERIREELPEAALERKNRLEQRLSELLGGRVIDAVRLAEEVAILADRSDIREEVTRMGSHAEQFRRLAGEVEPVGRKLDFLLQEMHREANTMGSKSSSARLSYAVVDLKSALERMREQVQNVE